MVFIDREDAGKKLAALLAENSYIRKIRRNIVVFSLIRGGAPVGYHVSKVLRCQHCPLVVKKIGAPGREELAIGAVCKSRAYLNQLLIKDLAISDKEVAEQVRKAKKIEHKYTKEYKSVKQRKIGKVAIIIDDGIATGTSCFVACMNLKSGRTIKKVLLAVPVAPINFDCDDNPFSNEKKCFHSFFCLYRDRNFISVSSYFKSFNQLTKTQIDKYY